MNRATIKSANRAIAKAGIPVELVRGESRPSPSRQKYFEIFLTRG